MGDEGWDLRPTHRLHDGPYVINPNGPAGLPLVHLASTTVRHHGGAASPATDDEVRHLLAQERTLRGGEDRRVGFCDRCAVKEARS
jgi:hypothetical protein